MSSVGFINISTSKSTVGGFSPQRGFPQDILLKKFSAVSNAGRINAAYIRFFVKLINDKRFGVLSLISSIVLSLIFRNTTSFI